MDDFVTAREAAGLLGVTLDTFYVYVSRKGIRSQAVANSRARRYWRDDVERLRQRRSSQASMRDDVNEDSALTLIKADTLFYRGRSVSDLSDTATFEQVAALLWGVEEYAAFTPDVATAPATLKSVRAAIRGEPHVNQALAIFPMLEDANPRALDLSTLGTAKTGADLLRWFAAIILNLPTPSVQAIHKIFAKALRLGSHETDLVRRLLVLSADHGMEPATFAVRAVASTGVSPWRAVPTGLSVALGRRSRLGHFSSLARFVSDILKSDMVAEPIVRRIHESDDLPGFSIERGAPSEPRARTLLVALQEFSNDPDCQRFNVAIKVANDIGGFVPTFALLSTFAWRKLGLKTTNAPFLMARSAGWIAHSIEQYQTGERQRRELHYRGPLPVAAAGDRR